MQRIKIIVNPSSGRRIVQNKLEGIQTLLLEKGYTLSRNSTKKKDDAKRFAMDACNEDWDLIIACGGDGTINEVISGVVESSNKVPIAILAAGTVNDFANAMKYPKEIESFVRMIENEHTQLVDVGKVNDRYFINVAAGGLMANIAHKAEVDLKTLFGKMGYYFEALRELPSQNLNGYDIRVESEEFSYDGKMLLYLISNSQSIGGVKKAAPKAEVSDGLLDVMFLKEVTFQDVMEILIKLQNGQHIENSKVEYFKTKKVSLHSDVKLEIDIDGEYGGDLPATFEVIPLGVEILIP
jgi:diacylglycerol kinase (ATP)